jgi:hypothetical protein
MISRMVKESEATNKRLMADFDKQIDKDQQERRKLLERKPEIEILKTRDNERILTTNT